VRERPGYRPTEFLITTGPGPVPRLDGQNIVFGKVVQGLDVVRAVATVPTFQPSERANAMNRLAAAIGDDRANAVRRKYGKPLKAVVILGSGVMPADAEAA
jgi:peptidyl-prolyl cis-trans isomerase B (cyclophilin B)